MGRQHENGVADAQSGDDKQLASASGDSMVGLWDAGTGAALQTFEGHSGLVWVGAASSWLGVGGQHSQAVGRRRDSGATDH